MFFGRPQLNPVITTLIVSDLFLYFGLGLISPIFGIFILENIPGANLETIGTAAAVYWTARIFSVVPICWVLDRVRGEKDEYYAVLIGTLVVSFLPLLYIFVTSATQLYMVEFTKGVFYSMMTPAWRILFTKFADRKKVGFSWSIEDIGIGVATATSAYFGALIAEKFGFPVLFMLVSVMSLVASYFLTRLYREEKINRSQRLLKSIRKLIPFR